MAHAHGADDSRYHQAGEHSRRDDLRGFVPQPMVQRLIELVDELLRAVEAKVLEAVERNEPDWLGVSTYTTTLGATVVALRAVRKAFPTFARCWEVGSLPTTSEPRSANFAAFLAVSEALSRCHCHW